jgi:hypothetical protein
MLLAMTYYAIKGPTIVVITKVTLVLVHCLQSERDKMMAKCLSGSCFKIDWPECNKIPDLLEQSINVEMLVRSTFF